MVSLKSFTGLMLLDLCISDVVEQMEGSGQCLQVDSDLCEPWEDEHMLSASAWVSSLQYSYTWK